MATARFNVVHRSIRLAVVTIEYQIIEVRITLSVSIAVILSRFHDTTHEWFLEKSAGRSGGDCEIERYQ